MRSKLIQHARNTYKEAPLSSWILGLITGVVVTAIIALDLLVPALSFILFPFIIVPILFSATMQHVVLKTRDQLTFMSAVRGFGLYYSFEFRGVLRFMINLIKSILVFFIVEMTVSFIATTVYQFTNPGYVDAVNKLYEVVSAQQLSIDDFYAVLDMNGGVLFDYLCVVFFPSLYISIIFLIYNLSRQSLMIYFKMQHPQINARFLGFVYNETVRGRRMQMLGDYLSLQWPLIILLGLGMGGGTVLGYFWQRDLFTMLACGLAGGALLATFFLPFYFPNQEAFYDAYADEIDRAGGRVASLIITNIQQNIDVSNEEKERLKKSFDDINPLDDDNKKDPDGPQ